MQYFADISAINREQSAIFVDYHLHSFCTVLYMLHRTSSEEKLSYKMQRKLQHKKLKGSFDSLKNQKQFSQARVNFR